MNQVLTRYTGLVTSEHNQKPNFMAVVSALLQPMVDIQNFMFSLPTDFDLDVAQWTELDALGQWIGLSRNLAPTAPGFYTQAPDPSVVPLSDVDYSTVLHGVVGANQWNGTLEGAYQKLTYMFGTSGSSLLFMIDNQNMNMVTCVTGLPSAGFKAALMGGYLRVRPAGVGTSYLFGSAAGAPIFGLDIENQFIAGLDVGSLATTS